MEKMCWCLPRVFASWLGFMVTEDTQYPPLTFTWGHILVHTYASILLTHRSQLLEGSNSQKLLTSWLAVWDFTHDWVLASQCESSRFSHSPFPRRPCKGIFGRLKHSWRPHEFSAPGKPVLLPPGTKKAAASRSEVSCSHGLEVGLHWWYSKVSSTQVKQTTHFDFCKSLSLQCTLASLTVSIPQIFIE